jgi:hypothetical protein
MLATLRIDDKVRPVWVEEVERYVDDDTKRRSFSGELFAERRFKLWRPGVLTFETRRFDCRCLYVVLSEETEEEPGWIHYWFSTPPYAHPPEMGERVYVTTEDLRQYLGDLRNPREVRFNTEGGLLK